MRIHTAEATAQIGSRAGARDDRSDRSRRDDRPVTATAEQRETRAARCSLDRKVVAMSVSEKVQMALHGNRDARQLLMRDRAGVVQSSLHAIPRSRVDEVQRGGSRFARTLRSCSSRSRRRRLHPAGALVVAAAALDRVPLSV